MVAMIILIALQTRMQPYTLGIHLAFHYDGSARVSLKGGVVNSETGKWETADFSMVLIVVLAALLASKCVNKDAS